MAAPKSIGHCGCKCDSKWWDFMNVMAIIPFPIYSWGFDVTVTPYLVGSATPTGFPHTWFPNFLPPDIQNPQMTPRGFYCGYRETWVYSDGVTTLTTVKEVKNYHWWLNPCDTMQSALDGFTVDPTDSARDYRIAGFPNAFDTSTINSQSGDDTLTALTGDDFDLSLDQLDMPPPTVTEYSVTQVFKGNGHGDWPVGTRVPVSYAKVLTDYITWEDYMAKVSGLLALVPLSPRHAISTREGELYFDYQRTTAIYSDMANLVPAGSYNGSGQFSWAGGPAEKIIAVQLGANETGVGYANVVVSSSTDDVIKVGKAARDAGWPYIWHSGQNILGKTYDAVTETGYTRVDLTEVTGGLAWYDSSATGTPDCFNLAVRPGVTSITFQNGVHSAAHTLYATAAHANTVLIFPLRGTDVDHATACMSIAQMPCVFAAANTWAAYLSFNDGGGGDVIPAFGGIFGGFVQSKSLVRIPQTNPDPPADPCGFRRMGRPYSPVENRLRTLSIDVMEPYSSTWRFYADLPPGEHVFLPSDIHTPTGWGFLNFGHDFTASAPPGAGATEVGASGSGTTQAAGGGDDSGI